MKPGRLTWRICGGLAVLVTFPTAVGACPTCQVGLAEQWQTQLAYAVSVGIMLSVPFLLLAGWCLALRQWSQPDADISLGHGEEEGLSLDSQG